MRYRLLLFTFALGLVNCHSDPYANQPAGTTTPLPLGRKPVSEALTISGVPPPIDIAEGSTLDIQVAGHVTKGKPILAFTNCPTFAVCDVKLGVIKLKPLTGDASDPFDTRAATRLYHIEVTLASTADPITVVGQTVLVTVHRAALSLQVVGFDQAAKIEEGKGLSTVIEIQGGNLKGVFTVSATDLPPGLKLTKTADPNKFQLDYKADFGATTVYNNDYTCYYPSYRLCTSVKWTLNVIDANGNQASVPASWVIQDVRQLPNYSGPDTFSANVPAQTASLLLRFEDPNGEYSPQVAQLSAVGGTVNVSTVYFEGVKPGALPYRVVQVDWTNVPASFKSTTQKLPLRACVYDENRYLSQCKTFNFNVRF